MKNIFLNLSLLVTLIFASSFQSSVNPVSNIQTVSGPPKGICVLYPTRGNKVTGTITYTKVENGVRIVADIKGLTKGKHGFHIHECGDCSANDGSSAGGHFNPAGKSHGAPMDMTRHMGDMGNIEADEQGNAHLDYVDNMIELEGQNSIIGRSVIIHNSEDDLKSQPTGNAGARVACGVIGIAKAN